MKQSKHRKNFYARTFHKEPRERFTEDIPLCKHFGCCKVLTPAELFLNPDYCFTHAREQKNKAKDSL